MIRYPGNSKACWENYTYPNSNILGQNESDKCVTWVKMKLWIYQCVRVQFFWLSMWMSECLVLWTLLTRMEKDMYDFYLPNMATVWWSRRPEDKTAISETPPLLAVMSAALFNITVETLHVVSRAAWPLCCFAGTETVNPRVWDGVKIS